ncbi:MAG: amidase, partial [Mesorhizobium sp.]
LLRMAGDFERSTQRRTRPPRTPELDDDVFSGRPARAGDSKVPAFAITLAAETRPSGDQDEIVITLELPGEAAETANIQVHVNGEVVVLQRSGARLSGHALIPAAEHQRFHSVWRGSYGSIVTAVVRLEDGRTAGAFAVTGGIK